MKKTMLPLLSIKFPREILAVHQIEITSRCNLRCVYCPSPQIMKGAYVDRPAMDMTEASFVRALEWVKHYVKRGTQVELNLAGIGESTLHPDFIGFLALARDAVGPKVKIVLATNGLIASDDFVAKMTPFNPRIYVSLHRPEKAGLAVEVYKKYGLLDGISTDPSTFPNDWAGQVKWMKSSAFVECQWMRQGKVFVLADGRIAACCLNADGKETLGHVNDEIGSFETKPWAACKSCYQAIYVRGYDQWGPWS